MGWSLAGSDSGHLERNVLVFVLQSPYALAEASWALRFLALPAASEASLGQEEFREADGGTSAPLQQVCIFFSS